MADLAFKGAPEWQISVGLKDLNNLGKNELPDDLALIRHLSVPSLLSSLYLACSGRYLGTFGSNFEKV